MGCAMYKLKYIGIIFLAILTSTLPSRSSSPPSREEVERILNGKAGSVNWSRSELPNGIVEYSLSVTNCSGANCRVVANRVWRQTKGWVYVDGHYFLAETIDSSDSGQYMVSHNQPLRVPKTSTPPTRLKFSAAIAKPLGPHQGPDLSSLQELHLQAPPAALEVASEILPSLIVGIQNGLEDLKHSLETSVRLHDAYINSLNQSLRLVEMNQQQAERTREESKMNSAISAIFLGQLQGLIPPEQVGVRGLERIRDLNEFQKHQKSVAVYREFELTEPAREQMMSEYFTALKNSLFAKATRLGETLINQRDQNLAAATEAQLGTTFRDGILRIRNVYEGRFGAPLDFFVPQSGIRTPAGQVVRRLANMAQIHWVDSQAMANATDQNKSRYLAALTMILEGDRAFHRSDSSLGYALMDLAHTLLDGSRGFVHGLADGTIETLQSVPQLAELATKALEYTVTNPRAVIDAASNLVMQSPEIARSLLLYSLGIADKFIEAPAEKRGEMLGHFASDVLVGYFTMGAGKLLGNAAKGIKIGTNVVDATKDFNVFVRNSGFTTAIETSAQRLLSGTNQLSAERLNGLKTLLKTNPDGAMLALQILGTGERTGVMGSQAGEFIGKLLASESPSLKRTDVIDHALKQYQKFDTALSQFPKSTVDETVWRGINKNIMVDGKPVQLTKDDVFKLPPTNKFRDHRLSIGGAEGESAIYTTRGESHSAKTTIKKESRVSDMNELIFDSKHIQSDRVLDLTNEKKLVELGIFEDINTLVKSKSHLDGQILGNVARKYNFDVVVVPSHFDNGINLVLLK